jgi:hypothetical protein
LLVCALLGWAVAGCGGDDRKAQVSLSLDMTCRHDANGSPVPGAQVPLPCGGVVAVHIVDADTDVDVQSACIPFGPKATMTVGDLAGLLARAKLDGTPVREKEPVTAEISVYSPGAIDGCPRYRPELARTASTVIPNLFGRSARTVVSGVSPIVAVPMACPLAPPSCAITPNVALITARVNEFITDTEPPRAAIIPTLDVRAGYLSALDPTHPDQLILNAPVHLNFVSPFWQTAVSRFFFPGDCVGVLVTGTDSGALPVLACGGITDFDAGTTSASGFFVDGPTMKKLIAALGQSSMPPGGVAIGRVLLAKDATPVGGATVADTSGDFMPVIKYINADFTGYSTAGGTAAHGYFVIDAAKLRCCHDVRATVARPGSRPLVGDSRAIGLVPGVVMASLIEVF